MLNDYYVYSIGFIVSKEDLILNLMEIDRLKVSSEDYLLFPVCEALNVENILKRYGIRNEALGFFTYDSFLAELAGIQNVPYNVLLEAFLSKKDNDILNSDDFYEESVKLLDTLLNQKHLK